MVAAPVPTDKLTVVPEQGFHVSACENVGFYTNLSKQINSQMILKIATNGVEKTLKSFSSELRREVSSTIPLPQVKCTMHTPTHTLFPSLLANL